jgi:hypothetical protein
MTTRKFNSSAMRRHLLLGSAAAWVLAPLAGCGGGAELLFVPFISFTFDGSGPGNQPISFFFGTANPSGCAVSGSFAANSNVSFNGASALLTGTFNGRRMDISFAAPPAGLAAAYTGEFIDDATVRMTPVGGGTAFNVVRQGPRPSSCPASG